MSFPGPMGVTSKTPLLLVLCGLVTCLGALSLGDAPEASSRFPQKQALCKESHVSKSLYGASGVIPGNPEGSGRGVREGRPLMHPMDESSLSLSVNTDSVTLLEGRGGRARYSCAPSHSPA